MYIYTYIMKVFLQQIKHYFLTVDTNGVRKKHMMEEFKDYDINEVNPVIGIGRYKSVATGFSRMLDLGLRNQERELPFQPFIIYEDDCSKFREFPEYLDIPDDTDLLYIGLSKCSLNNIRDHVRNYFENVNDDIVKIYNMLSAHGIMVCSALGAHALQKAVIEGFYKNNVFDIFLAPLQSYYNMYALRVPLVYQEELYGGNEGETKFTLTDHSSSLPTEYINTTNDSVITCYCKK